MEEGEWEQAGRSVIWLANKLGGEREGGGERLGEG